MDAPGSFIHVAQGLLGNRDGVQNLCFLLPVASQPAGTGARFLFVTPLRGGCVITAAKVLISGSCRDQMAQIEMWNCARVIFHDKKLGNSEDFNYYGVILG